MNIFVIGASGFLGRHVVYEMLRKDDVKKIYCLVHKTRMTIRDERIIEIKGTVEKLDYIGLKDTIDVCVVLSGITDGKETDKKVMMKINYGGVLSAIAYCKRNQIKRICIASSINVRLDRQGIYAKSKLMAEKAVKDSGLSYLIFRPSLLFGKDGDKGLKVVEEFIMKYGIVPVFGNGKKLEQPIWVDECAAFIAYYLTGESWNRTVELLGRDAMTYNQMCRLVAVWKGKKVRLLHVPVYPCILGLKLLEILHIGFPVSKEQIYHIDTDLACNMERVYHETGIYGDSFENNIRKDAYS